MRFTRSARGLTLLDFAANSAGTFLLGVIVARESTPEGFGVFAMVWACIWVAYGTSRAAVGELDVLASARGDETLAVVCPRHSVIAVTGWALFSSILLGFTLGVAGVPNYILFAAAMFVVVVQDWFRYWLLSVEDIRGLAFGDFAWLLGFIAASGLLGALNQLSVASALIAYVVSGLLPVVALAARASAAILTSSGQTFASWWAVRKRAARGHVIEFLTNTGVGQAAFITVGFVASLGDTAALRVGTLLIGLIGVFFSALLIMSSEALTARRDEWRFRDSPVVRVTATVIIGVVFLIVGATADPFGIGRDIFGESWAAGRKVIPYLCLAFVFQSISQQLVQHLKITRRGHLAARARYASSAFQALGLIGGSWLGGAIGGGIGLFASAALSCVLFETVERRSRATAEYVSTVRPKANVETGP